MNNVIEIENIQKIYQVGTQEVRALRGVTTQIKRGDYVAIMGPSGSGKSTLMNIIGGLDTPTAGRYVLNGTDVSHLHDDRLAEIRNKEIGFVFQTFNLLHQYTALENVILPLVYAGVPKQERIQRGKEALEKV
ncbi:MAG TPA: ATP-binding cassette domain-containing protein, partial [Bacteroidales bacterium]|nr:ATP-binding cassette domain-containing protein [Bacteroidales bacterium]